MKVILANPGTSPYIGHSVQAYFEADILDAFYTTFVEHPDYWLSRTILKVIPPFEREVKRRAFHYVPNTKVNKYPAKEILRTLSSRYFSPVVTDFIWEWAETSFDRRVASHLSTRADAVHVYEHAALASLQRAKKLGILSVYEQPSQHHAFFSQVVARQLASYPELRSAATNLLHDGKAQRRNQRRDQELALSDAIVCNSSFTRRTLVQNGGIAPEKVTVIPYGFPEVPADYAPRPQPDKVIFINAGTQNLRKALHLLYGAWRKCHFKPEEAELWLIGKMGLPETLRSDLPGRVVIKDSIPRTELMDLYRAAHVFVLPTLADGFGMVITEAMSRGLAVITTENSAGPDVITSGQDGFVVPAGDEAALVARMNWCVQNKHLLPQIGQAATEKARKWQWADFRKAVANHTTEKIARHKARQHA